jgi:hypothetical protein
MNRTIHLMALGIAIAVNGAALTAVNVAMVGGVERERLSQEQQLGACPSRKTL